MPLLVTPLLSGLPAEGATCILGGPLRPIKATGTLKMRLLTQGNIICGKLTLEPI